MLHNITSSSPPPSFGKDEEASSHDLFVWRSQGKPQKALVKIVSLLVKFESGTY